MGVSSIDAPGSDIVPGTPLHHLISSFTVIMISYVNCPQKIGSPIISTIVHKGAPPPPPCFYFPSLVWMTSSTFACQLLSAGIDYSWYDPSDGQDSTRLNEGRKEKKKNVPLLFEFFGCPKEEASCFAMPTFI